MTTIAIANPALYANDVNNPTNGAVLLADLNTIVTEVNAKDTAIASVVTNVYAGVKSIGNGLGVRYSSASTVTIQPGGCVADDGSDIMRLNSPQVVSLTTTGANALDTGVEAANTWYYVYLIKQSATTGTVSGLISNSSTSPVLPAGYTKKRYLGAFRNDGSSNLIPSDSDVDRFRNPLVTYSEPQLALSAGTSGSIVTASLSSFAPPTARRVLISFTQNPTSTALYVAEIYNGTGSTQIVASNVSGNNQISPTYNTATLWTDASQNIKYRSRLDAGSGANNGVNIYVVGFIESEVL